jgi:hypothetical protein
MSQLILDTCETTTDRRTTMAKQTASETQIAPQEGVLTCLISRVRSRQLDDALALGTPPESDGALALRARRLTTLRRRRVISRGLRRVIHDTAWGAPPSQARISPRRTQVIAANDELTRLADVLASPGPVAARGVAQAWILLTDGTGALYNANSTANLRTRAASAANSLQLAD